VDAPLPSTAETLHVCVSGTGTLDLGAGNGRAAFTGILAGSSPVATVQALDADGAVLGEATAAFGADIAYVLAPWTDAVAPCDDPGGRAPADAATWLLGIRFAEPSWS
jgi:predicted RNA methylase